MSWGVLVASVNPDPQPPICQKSIVLKAQELWGLSGSEEEKADWVSAFLLLFIYQCAHTM